MSAKEPIVFKLSSPIKLSVDGKFEKQYELYLYSPSNKDRKLTRKLRQQFMHVIADMQNKFADSEGSGKESGEMDGNALIQAIYLSDNEINNFIDTFKTLATNGAVKFINDTNINSISYDEISEEDEEKILGEYLANFILTSLMKQLNES